MTTQAYLVRDDPFGGEKQCAHGSEACLNVSSRCPNTNTASPNAPNTPARGDVTIYYIIPRSSESSDSREGRSCDSARRASGVSGRCSSSGSEGRLSLM
jgi:hypothetical protein